MRRKILVDNPQQLFEFSWELEPEGDQDGSKAGAQSLPSSDHRRRGPE
jgi:hypothetical protein